MLDRLRSVLPLVAFAVVPACAATTPEGDGTEPDAVDVGGAETPSGSEKTTTSTPIGDSVVHEHTPASPPEGSPSATGTFGLWLDGASCTILKTGLEKVRNGWTLTTEADCGPTVVLKISGRMDVRYPQTELTPLGDEQAVTLVIRNIGPHEEETFDTSQEGNGVVLVGGPTPDAHSPVMGKALVSYRSVGQHYLRFKLHY